MTIRGFRPADAAALAIGPRDYGPVRVAASASPAPTAERMWEAHTDAASPGSPSTSCRALPSAGIACPASRSRPGV